MPKRPTTPPPSQRPKNEPFNSGGGEKRETTVFTEPKVVPTETSQVQQPSPGQGETPVADNGE